VCRKKSPPKNFKANRTLASGEGNRKKLRRGLGAMTTLLFKGSLSLNVHRTDSHGRPVFKKLEDSLFKPRVLNVSPSSCVSRISAKLGCFTQSTMNTLSRCSRTNPVWKPFREQTPGFNSISVRQAVNVVHVPYLLICVHFPRR